MNDFPHGKSTGYRRGCRCEHCCAANTKKLADYRRRRRSGHLNFMVSAELCREHLRDLAEKGLGYRAISDASGIAWAQIRMIRSGKLKHIRERTERMLMRVDETAVADYGKISSERTRKMVDEIRRMGYTLAAIGRMLGHTDAQFYHRRKVTARTQMRVEKLYARLLRQHGDPVERMIKLSEATARRAA